MGTVLEGRTGHPVDSNDKGELLVLANTITEHHEAATKGNAYFMPIDGVSTNGAEHLAVMKNTAGVDMVVSGFTLFVGEFKDSTRIKVYLNETFVYLAEGTAVVPTNLKSGTVGGADGLFYTIAAGGTDITTFAGTAVIGGIYVFTTTPLWVADPGGWIIPPNQVFSLYNVGNDNTFYGGIDFYYNSH